MELDEMDEVEDLEEEEKDDDEEAEEDQHLKNFIFYFKPSNNSASLNFPRDL